MATCTVCGSAVEDGCETCEQCEGDKMNPEAVKFVRSELLAYACTYVNRCTPDAVIKTIVGFYSVEDIISARDLLWETYAQLDPAMKRRCYPTSNITIVTKVVEDIIIKGLLELCNDSELAFPFCAVDMTKIPKFTPEEENMQSVLVRLARMEQEMKSVQRKQEDMEEKAKLTHDVAQRTEAKTMQQQTQIDKMIGNEVRSSNITSSATNWPSISTAYSWQKPPQCAALPPRDDARLPGDSAKAMDLNLPAWTGPLKEKVTQVTGQLSQDGWQQQKADRRKRIRELQSKTRTVTGTQDSTNITSVGPTKAIYVYDIDLEVADKSIKELITGKGVQVKQMIQILGRNNRGFHKSFKVIIPEENFDEVMSEVFWPKGVKCREWIQDDNS